MLNKTDLNVFIADKCIAFITVNSQTFSLEISRSIKLNSFEVKVFISKRSNGERNGNERRAECI